MSLRLSYNVDEASVQRDAARSQSKQNVIRLRYRAGFKARKRISTFLYRRWLKRANRETKEMGGLTKEKRVLQSGCDWGKTWSNARVAVHAERVIRGPGTWLS